MPEFSKPSIPLDHLETNDSLCVVPELSFPAQNSLSPFLSQKLDLRPVMLPNSNNMKNVYISNYVVTSNKVMESIMKVNAGSKSISF